MQELHLEPPLTFSSGAFAVANEPLSVAAPRASCEEPRRHAPATAHVTSPRVAETLARGEQTLAQLEGCMKETRDISSSAVVHANELQERLRLGVRMLQALDVQLKRAEEAAPAVELATDHVSSRVDKIIADKLTWLDGEIQWRLSRLGEVESRLENAVNERLAAFSTGLDQVTQGAAQHIDASRNALEAQLARARDLVQLGADAERSFAQLEQRLDAARHVLLEIDARLGGGVEELDARAETLASLRDAALRMTQTLSEACAETATSLTARVEESRRMQDSLRFLVERGEEMSGSLAVVEDRIARSKGGIDATLRALEPWEAIVIGGDPAKIASAARGIAAVVREQLSSEMKVVSASLRQFANRTERAFTSIELDADGTARSLARAPDARELAIEVLRLDAPAFHTKPVAAI